MFLMIGAAALMGVGVVLLVVAARVLWRAQRNAGHRIIGYLEAAVRLDAPLPEMMEAAAATEPRRIGIRLYDLAENLRRGVPVRDALALATPQVPHRVREMIGVAERIGRLRPILREMIVQQEKMDLRVARPIDWVYPILLIGVLAGVVGASMIFIVPKFQQIMADFDQPLPATSLALFTVANFVSGVGPDGEPGTADDMIPLGPIAVLLVYGAATALFVLMAVEFVFGWRIIGLAALGQRTTDLAWRLPLIGRVVRDRQLGDVCCVVAAGLRASVPLHSALMETQTMRLSTPLRRKIMRWADGVRGGMDTDEAARAARMPGLIVGMFATGQAAGNPTQAFDFLHRHYSGRFSRSIELMRGAIVPAAVLVMGALVAWVMLALLLPVFHLIDHAARHWG